MSIDDKASRLEVSIGSQLSLIGRGVGNRSSQLGDKNYIWLTPTSRSRKDLLPVALDRGLVSWLKDNAAH